jgi:hypothetical protein
MIHVVIIVSYDLTQNPPQAVTKRVEASFTTAWIWHEAHRLDGGFMTEGARFVSLPDEA